MALRFRASEKMYTLRDLYKMKEIFDMDWEIQRDLVWNNEKKSLLIHSFLYGYYVPNLICMEEDEGNLLVMDGKQRLSTIFDYLNDGFGLVNETPDLDGVKIAGLFFSQLPEEIQNELLSATITIVEYKKMSIEERDDFFYRLNNGVSLNRTEKVRSIVGGKILNFVKEIKQSPFFEKKASITKGDKKRFRDENVIMQTILLAMNNFQPIELSGDNIENTFGKIDDIPNEVKELIRSTTNYLDEAFPVNDSELKYQDKILKKSDIPMIYAMAVKAQEMNIEPLKFSGWYQAFYKNQKSGSIYKNTKGSGTVKKDNVQKRLIAIQKDFDKNILNAPEFVMPEIKQTTGRRGRPRKNTEQVTEPIQETA
jgi:hypothetical protein